MIYTKCMSSINSTILSVTIGLSLYEFGPIGIIYGPLVVSGGLIFNQVLKNFNNKE